MNNIVATVDATGVAILFGYDRLNRKVTGPPPTAPARTTRASTVTTRSTGWWSSTGRSGTPPRCAYTFNGKAPVEVKDAVGTRTTYMYDGAGRVRWVLDPDQKVTSYTYDGLGQLRKIRDPRGKTIEMTYDANGNLETVIDRDRRFRQVTYDELNRRTEERLRGSGRRNWFTRTGYDTADRLTSATDSLTTTTTGSSTTSWGGRRSAPARTGSRSTRITTPATSARS